MQVNACIRRRPQSNQETFPKAQVEGFGGSSSARPGRLHEVPPRSHAEVRKLVAGPGIFICNDCISAGSRALTGHAPPAVEPSTFTLVNADARDTRCNFCGKQRRKVKAMATGTGGAICDQCLDLCQEIPVEDRAPLGRKETGTPSRPCGAKPPRPGRCLLKVHGLRPWPPGLSPTLQG